MNKANSKMNKMVRKKQLCFAIIIILLLAAAAIGAVWYLTPPKIYINEICSANDGLYQQTVQVRDAGGELCDWIEIYNPTDSNVSLSNFSIRKDGGEQFPLGNFTVKANDYIIVYCSSDGFDRTDVPTVNFGIPKAEECEIELIYASSACQKITVCSIEKGNSYSRNESGEMYVSKPTPLAKNSEDVIGSTPVFSVQSGFYTQEFSLEISVPQGQTVYYTLDGTDPTNSPTRILYTGAIKISDRSGEENVLAAADPTEIQLNFRPGKASAPADEDVDKGTVVRACAQGGSGEYGKVSTAAYFVGLTTQDHSGLPVISVVTDPDNLYDPQTGIYCLGDVYEEYLEEHPDHLYNGSIPANYNQKGREWERECYIEFFESDGTLQISQDAGMRIQGGWSRADYQKSFRFYARGSYGKSSFDYAFWEGLTDSQGNIMDSFDTLVIRNGGNDCNYTKFKDTMIQDMVSDRDFATQTGRACVLFIDGEYWGLYTLQEDYTAQYFSNHYGVAESDVVIYKNGEIDEGDQSDLDDFNQMLEFITTNDMSDEENYRKACSMIDMESFADYIAAQCYIFNDDWPQNNYGCWKTRTTHLGSEYTDGRWRFFMFDTESCAYHYNKNTDKTDTFTYLESKSSTVLGSIIWSLLKNEEFSTLLITRLLDMGSICFDYERYEQYLAQYKAVYYEEMESYYKRFPTVHSVAASTDAAIERMSSFFSQRQQKLLSLLESKYNLSQRRSIGVNTDSGGKILLNGSEIPDDFSGTYYDGCEITLTAVPSEGYTFVGWNYEQSTDEQITVTVEGDMSITAVFEKSTL